MKQRIVTRRELLKGGAATVAGLAPALLPGSLRQLLATPVTCAKLTDIQIVVIFIQENRSFDHYFGSYRGVRGFADHSRAFLQPDPANVVDPPVGTLLPFHLDTSKTNAACTRDITHAWVPQHQSWNQGAMNGFITSRLSDANNAVLTLGYSTRGHLPFYYPLAEAVTISCTSFN